jgi:hypothetical protein
MPELPFDVRGVDRMRESWWIKVALRRPGILQQKAEAVDITLEEFIDSKGHDPVTQRQVNFAKTLRRLCFNGRLRGSLFYDQKQVNPEHFNPHKKDLRKLIGYCRICGIQLFGRTAIPNVDYYDSDIYGDNTLVVQCDNCTDDRGDEI